MGEGGQTAGISEKLYGLAKLAASAAAWADVLHIRTAGRKRAVSCDGISAN